MRVWIDQDLCTGDGLCEEIAPDVFFGADDGLYYVQETAYGEVKQFDGIKNPLGADGMARFPEGRLQAVIDAATDCPGECIFIEPDED